MGALHAGHAALIQTAVDAGHFTVVSIFVNPTQFGPAEDFTRYPRDEDGDLGICDKTGAAAVFLPAAQEIYPVGSCTHVRVHGLSEHLCGPKRPGHFEGVATVVSKLFNIVQPDVAYFGQKDAQQLAILRQMTRDLDFPIEIVGCPTVREADGLALSSRNRYLSSGERRQATCLSRALLHAAERIKTGERDADRLRTEMAKIIADAGPATVDYISVVSQDRLQPLNPIDRPALIALAVRIGSTRLIDNVLVGTGKDWGASASGRCERIGSHPRDADAPQ